MKRSAPLRRGAPLRRKTRLKPRSDKTAARDAIYAVQRYAYLSRNPFCVAKPLGFGSCSTWATDVHHLRGRVGALMLDEGWWAALCRPCHSWVTDHPDDNRRLIAHLEAGWQRSTGSPE